mgnify:CR=1 FL=1
MLVMILGGCGQTCAMAITLVKIKLKDKNHCGITNAIFDIGKFTFKTWWNTVMQAARNVTLLWIHLGNANNYNLNQLVVCKSISYTLKNWYSIGLPFLENSANQQLDSRATDTWKFKQEDAKNSKSEYGRVWYFPHHAVYHAKVPGKVRVVTRVFCHFFWGGGGLRNSQLLQGYDSIIRCTHKISTRRERIAVQGDVEVMFAQINEPKKLRDSIRFHGGRMCGFLLILSV